MALDISNEDLTSSTRASQDRLQPEDDADEAASSLPFQELWDAARGGIEQHVAQRPLVALGLAAGAGYVLGGGLPRMGWLGVLGIGGLVGYAAIAARRGPKAEAFSEEDADVVDAEAEPAPKRRSRRSKRARG